ncbi:MAG: zinc ribbon domain-containing protein [Rivularia sp. (in: cyanobacteria)]
MKKSLSTRTHSCSKCGFDICRDTNAAINILKKGFTTAT